MFTCFSFRDFARKTCKDCRVPDDDVTPKVLTDLGFSPSKLQELKQLKEKVVQNVKKAALKVEWEFMKL